MSYSVDQNQFYNNVPQEEKKSSLKIPFGGIALGVVSAVLFFLSTKNKTRSNNMENAREFTHATIEQANQDEYVSLSGSVQPMIQGKYIRTSEGIETVLNQTSIVEKVRYTHQEQETIGIRTRNPKTQIRRRQEVKEEVVSPAAEQRVNFGLFDAVTRKNIELEISSSIFESSLTTKKTYLNVVANNNNNGGGFGLNININTGGSNGGGNRNEPVLGEISREVESRWRVERFLPVDVIVGDNDRLRLISTVFGYVQKMGNHTVITDAGATYTKPCVFAIKSRNSIISEEKFSAKLCHYFGIFFVVLAGVSTYFELNAAKSSPFDERKKQPTKDIRDW